mgnify:CR=1 FL=1
MDTAISGAALGGGRVRDALGILLFLIHHASEAEPVLILSYLFLVDAALLGLVHREKYFTPPDRSRRSSRLSFSRALDERLSHRAQSLHCAGCVFRFRAVAFVASNRRCKDSAKPRRRGRRICFRAATLLLVLLPIFKLVDRFVSDLAAGVVR